MNNWMNSLVDSAVQCWGCPVFDRLFQIVSDAAGAVYDQFVFVCIVIFCVLFAFYLINAVWQNIKGGAKDPWYTNSVQRVFINSLVTFALLGMGIQLPRFISTVTFEPVARIALDYSQSMLRTDDATVNEKVTYQTMKMSDSGFYRPQLRDTIVIMMKTTITQFQSYMKLGIAVIDKAFTWKALLGVGTLIKHIIMFLVGLYLFYGFFKLFVEFCFYFADVIVAMTFFAFFFPLSLVLISFKGVENVPAWIAGLGKSTGTKQFKTLINAIITLVAVILTYTVMMVIIARFFTAPGQSTADIMAVITSGEVFEGDLSSDSLSQMTLATAVVLIYVLDFIYKRIPEVTNMVLAAFNVSIENQKSEELAKDAMRLTAVAVEGIKKVGATILSGGEKKDDKSGGGKK